MKAIVCDNLDEAIERYRAKGYRLDMILPADDPREALMSKEGRAFRLQKPARNTNTDHFEGTSAAEWIRGRAGMLYRDLIPDSIGGKLIASHIRLAEGGPVADQVHYHKAEFQMIYCLKGRIKVVYEDQGPPFWLESGDCVVQPPEIRHQVLECTAGAEVLEIAMPAEHETWIDHEMELPNRSFDPERLFNGQRFVLTRAVRENP